MLRLFIIFLALSFILGIKDGLFDTEDDDVLPLNNETLQNLVIQTKPNNKVWVVEFYNSWCGHCVNFAPVWKKVATDLKEWRDIIGIAALDCSQKVNLEACRDFEVEYYPTIKIFPPVYSSKRAKSGIELKARELIGIKTKLFEVLANNPTDSWPNLKPLANIEDIWQEKKDSHKHVLLIFEEADSILGKEVMLDVKSLNNVLLRTMVKDSVTKYGINKFPSLYKVNQDSTYTVLAVGIKSNDEDRKLFAKVIQGLSGGAKLKQPTGGSQSKLQEVEGQRDGPFPKTNRIVFIFSILSSKVSMQDLESAIHYSLRQEVAIKKSIDKDRLSALKEFVHVLEKYLPGREPVLKFLNKVYNMLNTHEAKNMSGEEWMNKLDSIQSKDSFLPEVVRWESCEGSSPQYRGYPCGMWTLFHVLTVEAFHQNSGNRKDNPQEVLLAVKGYMEYFFGCSECSRNFLSMAATIADEVKSHKDSVLWLWSAHNKANKRLQGDASEDPDHPKVHFPPEHLCQLCNKMIKSDQGMSLSWDVDKVLEFLLQFYSEKNIVFSINLLGAQEVFRETGLDVRTLTHHKVLDWWEKKQNKDDLKQVRLLEVWKLEKRRHHMSVEGNGSNMKSVSFGSNFLTGWGLTQLDLSMCIIFYVMSTLIILFLYYHFISRRKLCSFKLSKNIA
ncbi:unnamed protein product [Lymnaea stagnalis]|uniref:Sulfhydryl oxidase n=1 Tax=Lymnaea stagnalis TaxID=6523 RepID=A0AAV2HJB8_LYMST